MARRKSTGDGPRIYVADLAAYNAGSKPHGVWIDAAQDPEDIQAQIDEMLSRSPEPGAEEYAIHDYEGFGPVKVSELSDLEEISKLARLIVEHGPLFSAVLAHLGGPQYLDDAVEAIEENYQGAYDSLAEWAERFADDTGAPAENYRSYVDWERVGDDAELGGDIFTVEIDGQIHVFWSR